MRDELTLGDRLRRADWSLLLVPILLTVLGIVTIGIATRGKAVDYAWLQVRWAFISFAACLLVLAVPYRRIVALRWLLYAATLLLLLLVLVAGSGKSAGRWIEVAGFRIQPSEFAKVVLIVTLAGYLRYETSYRRFGGLAIPFAVTLVPVVLIMKQPDLGTALLCVPILFVMLFVAGARPRHLGLVAAGMVAAGLVMYFVPGLMKEYQKDRIRAFARQSSDDPALRQSQNHQLHLSKVAVGTAGFFGTTDEEGEAEAIDLLPERHTDFAFPVFVSAFGLAGTTGLLLLVLVLVALLFRTALRVREPSGRLLAVGAATLFGCQAVVNMGMTLGLLPIVGATLPFVSYGGSSLLTSYLALGLAINAGAERTPEFGRDDFS
jgi:rod shape determining protein RodA